MKHFTILIILFFGLNFSVVGGLVAFLLGKPILDNAKASTTWPTVPGVIEHSEVVSKRDSDGDSSYSAEVVYQYVVNDEQYTDDTVGFGADNMSHSSRGPAHAIINQYPVGQEVEVAYEPDNPANAVLEPGVTWKSYVPYGIGLMLLGIGVLMLGYVAIMGFIVFGAATGLVGGRKSRDYRNEMPTAEDDRRRIESASRSDEQQVEDDDGFSMS